MKYYFLSPASHRQLKTKFKTERPVTFLYSQ